MDVKWNVKLMERQGVWVGMRICGWALDVDVIVDVIVDVVVDV